MTNKLIEEIRRFADERPFHIEDFADDESGKETREHIQSIVNMLNRLREEYLKTGNIDYIETMAAIIPQFLWIH